MKFVLLFLMFVTFTSADFVGDQSYDNDQKFLCDGKLYGESASSPHSVTFDGTFSCENKNVRSFYVADNIQFLYTFFFFIQNSIIKLVKFVNYCGWIGCLSDHETRTVSALPNHKVYITVQPDNVWKDFNYTLDFYGDHE